MQTVDYEDLIRGSALKAGLNPDDLAGGVDGDYANLRLAHSLHLGRAWIQMEWPFLCSTEKRYFRDVYSAAEALAAGAERYHVGTGLYYQTLRACTGQEPATWNGTTWTANKAYWAQCASEYSASEYSATAAYTQGAQVFYTPTGLFYQLYAASSTGNAPTNAAFWGPLTSFAQYVAYDQTGRTAFDEAFRAWDRDPNTDRRACQLDAWLTNNGLQLPGPSRSWVWVDLRQRCPQLTGEVWSDSTTYAVGDQVYFRLAPSYRGNLYTCATATDAGESPATHAAKWTKLPLPKPFAEFLIHCGAGEILSAGTEEEKAKAAVEFGVGKSKLDEIKMLYLGQCASRKNTRYQTR